MASGGTVERSVVYVEAERGVVYASWRVGESRNLGYERVRRSGGRQGKSRLLRYYWYISML
jgi:hypothetical protein